MNVLLVLKKESEDELTARYTEEPAAGSPLLVSGLVLGKSGLSDPAPSRVAVRIEWVSEASPPATGGTAATFATMEAARPWGAGVKAGDRLTVVKSKVAGVKSPPEWLEQYVGRTGTVLWTTADGAMLDVDGKASWFSYLELKPEAS